MHYAEFAEDEVWDYWAATSAVLRRYGSYADQDDTEPGFDERHQGVREQQVEGHRPESWQAGQGMRAIRQGTLPRYVTPALGGAPQASGTHCLASDRLILICNPDLFTPAKRV